MAIDWYFYKLGAMCFMLLYGGWSSFLFLQSNLRLALQMGISTNEYFQYLEMFLNVESVINISNYALWYGVLIYFSVTVTLSIRY